jgi:hypothetical protein
MAIHVVWREVRREVRVVEEEVSCRRGLEWDSRVWLRMKFRWRVLFEKGDRAIIAWRDRDEVWWRGMRCCC